MEGNVSVRKRKWVTKSGEIKEAWIAEVGPAGDRHIKTFDKKGDAVAYESQINVDLRAGVHVTPSKSPTVKRAGEDWIAASEAKGLERSTLKQYREHLRLHIVPFIGDLKLADLSAPTVRKFENKLRESGRSPAMTRMVISSLGGLIGEAVEHGAAATNPVRDLRRNRKRKGDRSKKPLEVGVDIPLPNEVSAIIGAAKGRWRPLIVVAAFTGLRGSELRGLRWIDVGLGANELRVSQRADVFNDIGAPKS